jgi:hypothetical protein
VICFVLTSQLKGVIHVALRRLEMMEIVFRVTPLGVMRAAVISA